MKVNYKNGMPILKMKVKSATEEINYEAYLDTGAGRTLIPEKDAEKLGLTYAGDTTVITGMEKDIIKLYRAQIEFLGEEFNILVFGRDLPEQAQIKAMIGRDILDKYRICFDGVRKEIEIT
ncbi:MAG: aspartyl protease family protein [Thermoproteota archaeon]|nr:aspartyl protease family protein [Thermoproteota archaeon]